MAGIGFSLVRMAERGGLSGTAAAGLQGALVTSGPWLLATAGITLLQAWGRGHMAAADARWLDTLVTYAFSGSALVAAPVIGATTRLVSDRLFDHDTGAIPGIVTAALATVSALALLLGAVVFGLLGQIAPIDQWLATALLAVLGQVWVVGLFLTAIERFGRILLAYGGGIATGAALLLLVDPASARAALVVIGVAVLVVDALLILAVRRSFAAVPVWPDGWRHILGGRAQIAAAGVAGACALWVDKWILWIAPETSVATVGLLRLNPVYDTASFLGLLSLIPGLTLLLLVVETRFETAFLRFMAACQGTATSQRIESYRRVIVRTIIDDVRLLALTQGLVAGLLWVLAPRIIAAIGADPRAVFALRMTVVGAVFHLLVVQASVILAYMDLFGRVLLVWAVFAVVSAGVTLSLLGLGVTVYGLGYLSGAICGATTAAMMVAQGAGTLTYLVFVGNNPAIAGPRRFWA